ncbi:helix-turn-helix transcriptional regulator [Streptomyces benahoarensis]|uniref:Helix-turn-helix transcriptional regulator n=1 Tax=Streptomyces benahoarensis TaxID=2595054 RepID=A0A553Z1U0_9ACTN|nr:helix-turn-helix transcriptional regulator [Streptomyces benahoarensis]TSB31878.1 helix-turn-helix transcriptional regulator [Streptomyces benahoarensis]TSB35399.1 helix-turn-helix transcriptional regulator [Streptomyces benahoarensis]
MTITDQIAELAAASVSVKLPPPAKCRKIRRDAKISSEKLGQILGVSGQTVRYWEKGVRQPSRERSVKYAEALEAMKRAVAAVREVAA